MQKNIEILSLVIVCGIVSIHCQIQRRQYVSDQQQVQVPVRRINVPYSLRGGQRSDQRPEFKELPVNKECPKCMERRLVQHYMAKGCTPVIKGGCDCPSRYDCPINQNLVNNTNVCWYRGKSYRIGDSIPTQNPCRICECRYVGRDVGIDCSVQIECPVETFGRKRPQDCYGFYEHNKCCSRDECPAKLIGRSIRSGKVCTYRGEQYRLGEKISIEGQQCMSCICTSEWDDRSPLDSHSCQRIGCDLELNERLKAGCTPIYHEETCCPIDYICPKRNYLRIQGLESGALLCQFEGRKYPIGSTLYNENKCVNCICNIPPEFTCTHKTNCH